MSRGKYSPNLPAGKSFGFNCYGKTPVPYSRGITESFAESFDEKTMFAHYDDEGFDSYGYSSFDADGNYVGIGCGVDRNGYTEDDYLCDYEGTLDHYWR